MSHMQCIDYGRSYVCTTGPSNAPRFWIESRCRIIDEESGGQVDFYQCGSCKSECTFAERDLLQADNYDFLPVFGEDGSTVVFRRKAYLNSAYATIGGPQDPPWTGWGRPLFRTVPAAPALLLDTGEKVVRATMDCLPIVSQTEVWNAETHMRAIIECPVKTMNIHEETCTYQVDTGPAVLPDLSCRYERPVESLRLAFVVFNAPHFADFVVEQPTAIVENGREVCEVHHYSGIQSLEAVNTLWAQGEP